MGGTPQGEQANKQGLIDPGWMTGLIGRVGRTLGAAVVLAAALLFSYGLWDATQRSLIGISEATLSLEGRAWSRYTLGAGPRLAILAPSEVDASMIVPVARRLSAGFAVEVLRAPGNAGGSRTSLRAVAAALGGDAPRAWVLVDDAADRTDVDLAHQNVLWFFHSRASSREWALPTAVEGRWAALHHYRVALAPAAKAARSAGRLAYEALIEDCTDSIGRSCAALYAQHIAAFAHRENTGHAVGTEFSDRLASGGDAPRMRVVPAGSYLRGDPKFWQNDEAQPRARLRVDQPLAVSRTEVTVAQYRDFVRATGRSPAGGCWHHDVDEIWRHHPERNWAQPGFPQDDAHPLVCVHWSDAQRYVQWLSAQTGAHYRLPTEGELEYLIRAGHTGDYGVDDVQPATICGLMNGADRSFLVSYRNRACSDGYTYTAPSGHYPANDFGLHDLHGNVWEWTQDCSTVFNRGALQWVLQTVITPSPWISEQCNYRVTRGGAWLSSPKFLKAHTRREAGWDTPLTNVGIRLVRELAPAPPR